MSEVFLLVGKMRQQTLAYLAMINEKADEEMRSESERQRAVPIHTWIISVKDPRCEDELKRHIRDCYRDLEVFDVADIVMKLNTTDQVFDLTIFPEFEIDEDGSGTITVYLNQPITDNEDTLLREKFVANGLRFSVENPYESLMFSFVGY